MNNKITRLVAFCMAVTLMIFSPAICSLGFDLYLNISMKSTGKLPTVKTEEKLEKLLEYRNDRVYVNVNNTKKNSNNTNPFFNVDVLAEPTYSSNSSNPFQDMTKFSTTGVASDSLSISDFATSKSESASDYSSTNVQVEGIDEADILKIDGKYIYMISNNKLVIVEAYPAETMKKVSETKIEGRAIDMFLSGEKLFLVTDDCKSNGSYRTSNINTKVVTFDVSDRTAPKEVKTFEFTGLYSSSRMICEKVYLFSTMGASRNGKLPQYRENNYESFQEVSLKEIQYVPNDTYTTYTQIFTFDLGMPLNSPKIVTYLGSSAQNVYMSQDNLYMAQKQNGDTVVYKFSLDSEYPRYEAKGKVEGTVINQFAMDEHNGNFRIATDDGYASRVYVLSESMHVLGSIKNIAKNEDMKSVRFEGDRCYLVTFRNTDPLFVIDLSKPRAPKMLGELKITGYSTYLQPYDENHVIGFGYDGTEWGTNGQLKLALFDISDVENPREKFKTIISASDSELLTNHKSLLFSKDRNLIAFSVGQYRSNKVGKVYTIDLEKGFVLRGSIEHVSDVNRMLYMDDVLYATSEKNVSAHDINTVKEVNRIEI